MERYQPYILLSFGVGHLLLLMAILLALPRLRGERGRTGKTGPGPTTEQIEAAVDNYFSKGDLT